MNIASDEAKDKTSTGIIEASSKASIGVVTAYFLFARSILSNFYHKK